MKTIITPQPKFLTQLWQIAEKKELLFLLMKREIVLRYKYKTIGIFWGIAQPLLLSFIISLSFGQAAQRFLGTQHYFLSVFFGFIFWMYFSTTLGKISGSLLANRTLLKNTAFPHILLPVSKLGVGSIDFLASLFIALGIGYYLGLPLFFAPVFFLCIAIMLLTTLGLGAIFAVLYARFSDLREVLGFVTTALFYLTPIIYPVNLIPAKYHMYLYLNPMAGVIETAKAALFSPSAIPFEGLYISAAAGSMVFLIGMLVFHHYDKNISDIL